MVRSIIVVLSDLHLGTVFVFFIYGLSFFTMGVALSLETARFPLLANRKALRLLAIFGILHGIHEWMEIILLQGVWLGLPFPSEISWLRVSLLTISFIPLVAFALQSLQPLGHPTRLLIYWIIGMLVGFFSLVAFNYRIDPQHIIGHADALARYLLAVPGGILAGIAFYKRSRQVHLEITHHLASRFHWVANGMIVYSASQIFVEATDMFPANTLNADLFMKFTGFPIQIVRASMAVIITINLVLAIHAIERHREHQLISAQQARVKALELVQQELVERESLRRELLRHIVIAQEEERARIARELHDETAQVLTAFSLNLAALRNILTENGDSTRLFNQLQDLNHQMSEGVYRLVHDLRPAQLDDLGLVPTLQYLVDESKSSLGLEIDLKIKGPKQRLDPLIETVIFRVVQEALSNVSRHAQTSQCSLELIFASQNVILRVSDAGIGFDLHETLSPPRGWGLAGMRERTESLNGEFSIRSNPGQGTTVEVIIPLFNKPSSESHSNQGLINEKDLQGVIHENHPFNASR
jgi:signal transduction histidine kinase